MSFFRTCYRFFYWGWKLRHSYDFDYEPIFYFLELKLTRMRSCFLSSPVRTYKSTDKFIRRITVCIELLKRLQEDDYNMKADLVAYQERLEQVKKCRVEDGRYILYPMVNSDRMLEMGKKAEYLRKQDMDLLFKLMRQNIQTWWD